MNTTSSPLSERLRAASLNERTAEVKQAADRAYMDRLMPFLISIDRTIGQLGQLSKEELTEVDTSLVDAGYLLRRLEETLDEARKEVKARKELIGRLLGMAMIAKFAVSQDPDDLKGVGNLARGYPEVSSNARVPKRGTKEYEAVCKHFGISEEATGLGLFTVHWHHMSEYVTALRNKGLPLPPGIEVNSNDYRMKYVKRSS